MYRVGLVVIRGHFQRTDLRFYDNRSPSRQLYVHRPWLNIFNSCKLEEMR